MMFTYHVKNWSLSITRDIFNGIEWRTKSILLFLGEHFKIHFKSLKLNQSRRIRNSYDVFCCGLAEFFCRQQPDKSFFISACHDSIHFDKKEIHIHFIFVNLCNGLFHFYNFFFLNIIVKSFSQWVYFCYSSNESHESFMSFTM